MSAMWPLSPFHFEGIRWERPWFLTVTYAALAAVFLILWLGPRKAEPSPRQIANGGDNTT